MGLFENGYKMSTRTELEKEIRQLEEKMQKRKESQAQEDKYFLEYSCLMSKIDFAWCLKLLSDEQADVYRERVMNAHLEFKHQNLEQEMIKNDEGRRSFYHDRNMSMEDVKNQIEKERMEAIKQEQAQATSKQMDDAERMKY